MVLAGGGFVVGLAVPEAGVNDADATLNGLAPRRALPVSGSHQPGPRNRPRFGCHGCLKVRCSTVRRRSELRQPRSHCRWFYRPSQLRSVYSPWPAVTLGGSIDGDVGSHVCPT